ncbi:ArsR/SmtB family transcription factor [Microbacterium saperdae]
MSNWVDDADLVFRGLTDSTRRAILGLLSGGNELSVNEIAAHFPEIGRTAISAHLRVLRESDLVAESKDGRQRLYRLGPNRAGSALDFLRQVYSTSVTPAVSDEITVQRKKGPGRPSRVRRTA